jgi:hypothetical protein
LHTVPRRGVVTHKRRSDAVFQFFLLHTRRATKLKVRYIYET